VIFLDTSVLIAIAQVSHPHHPRSRDLWNGCKKDEAAVGTHTIAEVYNTLSAFPPGLRLSPRDTVTAVEIFLKRLAPVSLSAEEYLDTLRRTANLGHSGDIVYDALHLACVR
jgi:predicted nucleic acid-binding protein